MTDRYSAASCQGPYGGENGPEDCGDPVRFEVARHLRAPLRVCPCQRQIC